MSNRDMNLTGQVFGALTVLEKTDIRDAQQRAYYRVRCKCGTEKLTRTYDLTAGRARSCGCRIHLPKSQTRSAVRCRLIRAEQQARAREAKRAEKILTAANGYHNENLPFRQGPLIELPAPWPEARALP